MSTCTRGSAMHPQLKKRNQHEFTAKMQQAMKKEGLDTMLLLRPENILYATGYKSLMSYAPGWPLGASVVIVPAQGKLTMIINSLELNAAESMTGEEVNIITYPSWCVIDDGEGSLHELPEKLDALAPIKIALECASGTIGMELSHITIGLHQYLSSVLDISTIIDINALMFACRMVKNSWEIEMLRYAAQHTDSVVQKVIPMITAGMPAYEMEHLLIQHGVELDIKRTMTSYNFICTYGPYNYNCGLPRGYIIKEGDIIKFDGGFEHLGYKSDIARTFAVGNNLGAFEEKVFQCLLQANDLGVSMIRPGMKLSNIYHAIREYVENAGVIPHYPRGHMGHSVGVSPILEEYPQISKNADIVLQENMVLSLETPFASAGKEGTYFGMNLEDTHVVTSDGSERFTEMPRSL